MLSLPLHKQQKCERPTENSDSASPTKELRKPVSRTKHFPRHRSCNKLRKPNRKIRQHNSNKKLCKPNKLTTRVQQNIFSTAGQTKNCDSQT
jgi:hypothetical protein